MKIKHVLLIMAIPLVIYILAFMFNHVHPFIAWTVTAGLVGYGVMRFVNHVENDIKNNS